MTVMYWEIWELYCLWTPCMGLKFGELHKFGMGEDGSKVDIGWCGSNIWCGLTSVYNFMQVKIKNNKQKCSKDLIL